MEFQFNCTNTLNEQTLENGTVRVEPTEACKVLCYMDAQSLPYNQPGTCCTLVALSKEDPTAASCTFSCIMKFTVRTVTPPLVRLVMRAMKMNMCWKIWDSSWLTASKRS